MTEIVVVTFYKFVFLPDCASHKEKILALCQQQGVKGTIILAEEGINATIAGSRQGIDAVIDCLRSHLNLGELDVKESCATKCPFQRMKVLIKQEIVTFGMPEVNPNQQVGTYVSPQEWNQVISDPEVTVVDTRNKYEVHIGTFQQAQNPQTDSFREFADYVDKHLDPQEHQKVALFCTGGIRCEKATSFMLSKGFKQVYHLQGGILKYLEEVPEEQSLWQGECFVFDGRVAVKHGLKPGSHSMCFACGHPLSVADLDSPQYEESISCPHCFEALTPDKKRRQLAKKNSKR